MPELPEVETVKETLKKLLIGKTIKDVLVFYKNIIGEISQEEFINEVKGQTINDIKRKGKFLIFCLDDKYLLSHLRMEGKYFIKPVDEEINKHEHIVFLFDDFSLRYHDTRKFGVMLIRKDLDTPPLSNLGFEPWDLTIDYLKPKMNNKPIKELLLDQSIISGLGNIYADEVCAYAHIHPKTPANSLNDGLGKGADRQGDLLLLVVDVGDLGFDHIADSQHLGGLADAAVGDLRDVDETIGAGQHFRKCTEGHQLDDLDLGDVADGVSLSEHLPGVHVRIAVAEGDLVVLFIEVDDVNIDLVADVQRVGRLVDAIPADLGNMDHAINAANVNKSAVGGHGLDHALIVLADLDLVPDLLGAFLALAVCHSADGADHALAPAVNFSDLQTDGLTDHLGHGRLTRQTGLGGRHEDADAVYGNNDAALVLFGDLALDDGAVSGSVLDVRPGADSVQALLGEHHSAFNVVHTNNTGFDLVTNMDNVFHLGGAILGELGHGDVSGMLGAQVDSDFRGRDADYIAGDGVPVVYRSDGVFQQFIKRLFGVGLPGGNLRNGLGFNGCGLFNRGRSDFLCSGLFYLDLVAHFLYYLLNNPRWHRGSGRNSDTAVYRQPGCVQFRSVGEEKNTCAFFPAQFCKVQAVCAVRSSDDDHRVAYPGKRGCISLPLRCCSAYSIKYFVICTPFF